MSGPIEAAAPGRGPLAGVRVLDLSRLLPGPACTWYLQGMGASVDRVETPGTGDLTRHIPPFVDGTGAYFAAVHAGKRSVALDLRKPGAIALIRRLLPAYDVVVESFKPGVMEAMGLDPAELLSSHPRLVVARLTGFGQTGPWRDRPGHDLNYVGVTGLLSAAAHTGSGPAIPSVQIADLGGALVAAMGVAAALFDRERTGRGRVLDVSLTESALSMFAPHVVASSTEGRPPKPGGEILTGGFPMYGTYRCADGKWLTVGAVEPKFQMAVAAQTGGAVTREDLEKAFATKPRDEWVAILADACAGPALDPTELAAFGPLAERGAVARLGKTTWVRPPFAETVDGAVPSIGEHREAILRDGGVAPEEIAAMQAAGVFG